MSTSVAHERTRSEQQADSAAAAEALAPFAKQQTVLLTTYRRTGAPVATPVSIAVEGDHAYIRSWETAGKIKRMRQTPEVTIALADLRGTPTGPELRAQARILSGAEARHAGQLLAGKHPLLHGVLVPWIHRLRRNRTTHVELTPIACPGCRP